MHSYPAEEKFSCRRCENLIKPECEDANKQSGKHREENARYFWPISPPT